MIKDRNIDPGAAILASKVQGILPEGPVTGEVHYVAKSGIQARTWLDGKVSVSNLHKLTEDAIAKCVASRGDVVYVCPGHTETIASAGDLTLNVAGVSVIGLGNANLRPTYTWSATDSTCAISAANVSFKNIITTVSVDEVVSMFNVTGAGVTLDRADFVPWASGQALQFLLTTNAADQLTIQNCNHRQTAAANTAQKWIQLVGPDNTRILNNTIWMTAKADTGSHAISGSTAVIQAEIVGNRIAFLGATIDCIINLVTGSTGIIADNRLAGGAAVVLAAAIKGDQCMMFENYVTNTAAASGIVGPVVDTVT